MAKKNKEHEEEVIVDVVEAYSSTQRYFEENQRNLTIIGGVLVGLILLYFGVTNFYLAPLEAEAKEQMWKAELYFEKDSIDLAINGDGNYFGFETIVDKYGMTQSGNLAHYYLGVCYFKKGEYQTAIDHLDDFSSDDVMVSSVAKGVTGDCYMQLDDLKSALSFYLKAANDEKNDFTTPIYLMKAGLAYEKLNDYKGAAKVYSQIKNDYPFTQEGRNIDKYLSRAEALK